MKVPLLDLKAQYSTIQNEVEETLLRIARSQMCILGAEVEKLEKTLAEYCGTKFSVGVSSGTDALLIALMALDIHPGDEVIMPTYSFFATAGAVARLNAIPVFVDSEPHSFNINPKLILDKISSKTKAIIPVHLYGQSAEMDEIMQIADSRGIPVIEDCAQAIGVQYKTGKKVGSFGSMGCFSFYPSKNLGAFGDGGLVTTNDELLYDKLKKLRNHGMFPKYHHNMIGGNFRLDAMQAGVLNVKFPHLDSWHRARRRNADLYTKYFLESEMASVFSGMEFDNSNKIILPKPVYTDSDLEFTHIYNQYVIAVQDRDNLRNYLNENGIGVEIYYPVPFHRQECFSYLINENLEYPVADFYAEHSLALPIYPELSNEQIAHVVSKILEFYQNK